MIISMLLLIFILSTLITFAVIGRPRLVHDTDRVRLVVGLPQLGKKPSGKRLERCMKSPQWKDGKFHNETETQHLTSDKNFLKIAREFAFKKHQGTRPSSMDATKTDLKALPMDKDIIVWFGHSSYFIQLGGLRILVDPVFYNASPVDFTTHPFKGTSIYKPADMPDIDLLIYTHNHYDHLDHETFRKLRHRVNRVVCPLGVGASIEFWNYPSNRITELDWWEDTTLACGASIACTPARHFSGRMLGDQDKTLWASFVLEYHDKKLFLGGDSGYDTHFKRIGDKYGPFDVAFLENGQYNADWRYIHIMPEEMPKACQEINAKKIFSVHHGKFALAFHPWDEPYKNIEDLRAKGIDVLPNKIGQVVKF